MSDAKSVRSVLIVGGGTAGWLTAAFLASTVGRTRGVDITLVETPDIGIIGVGEATIPTLPRMLRDLGIREEDFLKAVNGGFKQAIRFQNWLYDPAEKESYFYHPFHKAREADVHAASQYLHLHPEAGPESFARLASAQTMACDLNKAPMPAPGDPGGLLYAYHMDAALFGRFLRGRFEGRAVKRIEGHVQGANLDGKGGIKEVVLRDGTRLQADLFIDCSGFRGLLVNQQLGVEFESFSDWLPCDRALAVSAPYPPGGRIRPYTVATAQKSGWIWDINLASRRGVGHVYSSAHQSRAEAESTLATYLGSSMPDGSEVREIAMRVGRCRELWRGNCVAIGLSGGFIEPLESTGIYLIEMGIRYLLDHWPAQSPTPAHRWSYNRLMHDAYDEVLEFVFMHYVTSQRRDSDFWCDLTRTGRAMPGRLAERLELWRQKYPSVHDVRVMSGNVFGHESFIAILAGMKWFQGAGSPYVAADREGLKRHLAARLAEFDRQVGGLPTHEAYLKSVGVELGHL